MFLEQPAQMAIGDAEARGEIVERGGLVDDAQRAADGGRGAGPRRRAGGGLRPAPLARPKPRRLGRRRSRIVPNIFLERRSRGADRTAVDACGDDGDEESSVETRIAAARRGGENVR